MKRLYFYIISCMFLFSVPDLKAQVVNVTMQDNLRVEDVQFKKEGNMVQGSGVLNLDNVRLGSAQMLILTPVIRSEDNTKFHRFRPMVFTGASRDRTLQRAIDWEGFKFEDAPQFVIRRTNKRPQTVPFILNAPYEEWFRGGELVFLETKSGCAYTTMNDAEYHAISPVLPKMIEPVYEYAYVIPPVEEVKQRSESHSAHLNFEVGRSVILRDFKNNADVLNDVDKVINEIRNDENLTVTEFQITGYASPEGNEQSNMKLSEDRAKAFVSYLTERYNIPRNFVRTDWRGEDWDGLKKVVEESGLSNKYEIMNVLSEQNVAQRKSRLKQLNGGQTYRMLLQDYYPQLRRNDYTIAFVAKKFSVDEAKIQIRTKPQYLSLNEMFLVANTYPKNSQEFKEVFDIASRMYPDNSVAQLNTGAMELETGAVDNAIRRLEGINLPEAWNNLGVAYAIKGDYQKAQEYLNRAIQAGNGTAKNNAE
ncbi:MAG: DUF3868 domain-containing protein [Tannerella sp.]|nr:DUF3868 domain-containing protein [Tannerella sp.]